MIRKRRLLVVPMKAHFTGLRTARLGTARSPSTLSRFSLPTSLLLFELSQMDFLQDICSAVLSLELYTIAAKNERE